METINATDKKAAILQLVKEQGVLPLFFYKDPGVSADVLRALYRAGIRSVEYTNRGEAALANFRELRKVCDSELKGMSLGVGTIKNAESARAFIDAGADYIISPGLVEDAVAVADEHDMLWVPGCMTPSEIIRAEQLGAKLVKLFPGNILGPGFLSAVKELFPNLLFMPTGGVEAEKENLSGWFKAGVCAVGLGSKLITKTSLETRDYAGIESLTLKALALIKEVRG
ncbi:MAG: bifunctional 4-hydroxy-2-oxoglutarate aldolase/2-dehydro-3-deoxy-phosphogluconate aldolase [Chitinophagaceae bacterium]|nr:MAG: bifunctional 4-hydroxy-2-oxoglutarate aldolase/2-dehydro-3-deoxy-phosphogluconate aldolase [Chitinophagaceae bacterium]